MSDVLIDRKNNRVRLSVNTGLYDKESLLKCIKDFSKTCEISKEENTSTVLVTLQPRLKMDLETLGYEFYNYLLGEIRSKGTL